MNLHRFLCLALLGVSLILAVGCGSSDKVTVENRTTVGQELKDLDEAYKKGLLDKKEYERTRKAILDRK